MAEVASGPMDKSFSKTFREHGTVFVLQKNHNDRGRYLTVTAYGNKRHQGHVVVPAGRDLWGWRGLAQVISELVMPVTSRGNPKPAEPYVSHNNKATFKEAVILSKVDTKKGGFDHVSYGKIESNPLATDSQHMEITFKMILSLNKAGQWGAEWAGPPLIIQNPAGFQRPMCLGRGKKIKIKWSSLMTRGLAHHTPNLFLKFGGPSLD